MCISSPAVSSPSQCWKVSRASSHNTHSLFTSVPLSFQQHHSALLQLSSWRINIDSPQTPPPSTSSPLPAALEFLNTDRADSPVKVSSRGLYFIVYPSLSLLSLLLSFMFLMSGTSVSRLVLWFSLCIIPRFHWHGCSSEAVFIFTAAQKMLKPPNNNMCTDFVPGTMICQIIAFSLYVYNYCTVTQTTIWDDSNQS